MPGLGVLPCPIMTGNAKLNALLLGCVCANACKLNILENSKKLYPYIFFNPIFFNKDILIKPYFTYLNPEFVYVCRREVLVERL
jgi:hypothetical protein